MNKNSGHRSRKITVIMAVTLTAVTLAGCSQLTYEEAQASDHRVVQTANNFLGGRDWSYIGPNGVEVPLTEDCRDHFFDGYCFSSPDGTAQLRYFTGKGGVIRSESIILDGTEMDAECKTDDISNSAYVCAPVPTD